MDLITHGRRILPVTIAGVDDTVPVSRYAPIAAQVKPKGSAPNMQPHVSAGHVARAAERWAGAAGPTSIQTLKIQSVDKGANTVTLQRADGSVRTTQVSFPRGQAFCKGLNLGDDADLMCSPPVAVAVTPSH
jgi:hypothetical protein